MNLLSRQVYWPKKSFSLTICRAKTGMRGKNKWKGIRGKEPWLEDDEDVYGGRYHDLEEEIWASMSPLSKSAPIHRAVSSDWKPQKGLKARNPRQEQYMEMLENADTHIVIATGSAGTGKTYVANALGLEKLQAGDYKKIIITRPIVSVSESLGYLPGNVEAKMHPWLLPIYDVFYKYITPQQVQAMIAKGTIEICPLAYMRGRSFEHAWIVADEMQNSTPDQMLMLLTRIGHGSKLIINGDPMQHDRGYEKNGLVDLLWRLQKTPQHGMDIIQFTDADVERHPILRKVLKLYNTNSIPTL
jgi:phosphate starvation-inducible protein PhoH and related proteins